MVINILACSALTQEEHVLTQNPSNYHLLACKGIFFIFAYFQNRCCNVSCFHLYMILIPLATFIKTVCTQWILHCKGNFHLVFGNWSTRIASVTISVRYVVYDRCLHNSMLHDKSTHYWPRVYIIQNLLPVLHDKKNNRLACSPKKC